MAFSLLWILVPIMFFLSWLLNRNDKNKSNSQNVVTQKVNKDYLKGLNFLLSDQQDQAIEVFIELLQVDSDTIETHLALACIFRKRGEVDRAIRIHQNLIARPNLTKEHHKLALHELGIDYLKAGFLDRAESIFCELLDMGFESEKTVKYLLDIYQQQKDWNKAIETISYIRHGSLNLDYIVAHFYCELALVNWKNGKGAKVIYNYLKQAFKYDRDHLRARILYAKYEMMQGNYKNAAKIYIKLLYESTDVTEDLLKDLELCYIKLDNYNYFVNLVKTYIASRESLPVVLVSRKLINQYLDSMSLDLIKLNLDKTPSIYGMKLLLMLTNPGNRDKELLLIKSYIDKLLDNSGCYKCSSCGYSVSRLEWLCPSCKEWGRIKAQTFPNSLYLAKKKDFFTSHLFNTETS